MMRKIREGVNYDQEKHPPSVIPEKVVVPEADPPKAEHPSGRSIGWIPARTSSDSVASGMTEIKNTLPIPIDRNGQGPKSGEKLKCPKRPV